MNEKLPVLPTTSYVILGLLSFGAELSGYEIRKWAQNLRFFYWSPAQSQVYSELQRLEELGLVRSRAVQQVEKPDKRLYQLTEHGGAELARWVCDAKVEPTIVKHSVALRLYFGHVTKPPVLIELLEKFIAETQTMLGQLAIVQEAMENEPQFAYSALVAEWSHHYYMAELAMAQRLIERLRQIEVPP